MLPVAATKWHNNPGSGTPDSVPLGYSPDDPIFPVAVTQSRWHAGVAGAAERGADDPPSWIAGFGKKSAEKRYE
jgi:hypothetical protein